MSLHEQRRDSSIVPSLITPVHVSHEEISSSKSIETHRHCQGCLHQVVGIVNIKFVGSDNKQSVVIDTWLNIIIILDQLVLLCNSILNV